MPANMRMQLTEPFYGILASSLGSCGTAREGTAIQWHIPAASCDLRDCSYGKR